MLTIYTTCKNSIQWPFYGILQYNAIKSWTLLDPKPEIFLIGNDPGTKELAEEIGVIHLPEVETKFDNVPVLPALIQVAEDNATNNCLLLCSSDIILFQETMTACKSVLDQMQSFCGVVRKSETKLESRLAFDEDWDKELKNNITYIWQAGAGDFFMHTKGYWEGLPPFVCGRGKADGYLYLHSSQKKSLIDMTHAITIMHQNHDKPEVGGRNAPEWKMHNKDLKNHPTYAYNSSLINNQKMATINNANWIMKSNGNIVNGKNI